MADRPLPILGSLTTGNILELVRSDPGLLEPDAGSFGALAQPAQVHQGSVSPTFHLQDDITIPNLKRQPGDFNGRRGFFVVLLT